MIYDDLIAEKPVKVLILDDVESETTSIRTALKHKEIPCEFRLVDLTGTNNDDRPLESVELVFLDLDYKPGYLNSIDPYLCAEQVSRGVNEGQFYYLVAWTKDPGELPGVVEALKSLNLTPVKAVAMEKVIYRTGDDVYNIDQLFTAINIEFRKSEEVQQFLGRIIMVEDECVLINCIMPEDPEF